MKDRVSENRISLRLALRPLIYAFHFSGRSTRSELISFYILSRLATMFHGSWDHSSPASPIFVGLGVIWPVIWSWPLFPLTVRRFHDQGRSGWWVLINALWIPAFLVLLLLPEDPANIASVWFTGFAPVWSTGFAPHHIASSPAAWFCGGILVVTILVPWVMSLLPGTYGTNSFGPDPRVAEPNPIVENRPADASA